MLIFILNLTNHLTQICVTDLAHSFFSNKDKKLQKAIFKKQLKNTHVNFFKPLKQKSQISLVFGMNALVPLGTIKTLSKTNLDFLYTP